MSGQIVKLEKGKSNARCRKWLVRVSLGRDFKTGRYLSKTKRVAGTYKDAEKALQSLVSEAECTAVHRRYTVRDYAREWMEIRRASGNVAQRTLDKNETHIKVINHLLGYAFLDKLTPLDIERAYAEMRGGNSPSGKPLSGTYVRCVHATLNTMLRHAVDMEVIARNPLDKVKPPTIDTPEKRALKPEDMDSLLHRLDPEDGREIALMLILALGLRIGEVCGLSWRDVDFGAMEITIAHSYTNRDELKSTKTGRVRVLPMPEILFDGLRKYKTVQRHTLERLSKRYKISVCQTPDTPVVCSELDKRLPPNALDHWWRLHRASYGMEDWTLHEFRHSYATLLAKSEIHPKVAQQLLGHTSFNTTMDVYTHVDMRDKHDAVDALNRSVFNVDKSVDK